MYRSAFALVIVCVSAAAAYTVVGKNGGCCLPNKMEMYEGMVLSKGKANTTLGSYYVAMDQTAKKIFANVTLFDGLNTTGMLVLQDYAKGHEYLLMGRNCSRRKLGAWTKKCIPAGSLDLGSAYFGHAGRINGVAVNTYLISNHSTNHSVTAYVSVTQEQPGKACLPVTEVAFGHHNKTSWTATVSFVNITMGVTNPHIFDIPTMCKKHPLPPHPKNHTIIQSVLF